VRVVTSVCEMAHRLEVRGLMLEVRREMERNDALVAGATAATAAATASGESAGGAGRAV